MFGIGRHRRAAGVVILDELCRQGIIFSVACRLVFSLLCVLVLGLLVLVSRFGHQGIRLGSAFDDAWFDASGAIADGIAGDLPKVVLPQYFPERFLRRREPLRHQRIARNGKAHLTSRLIVNRRGRSAYQSYHVIPRQCRP